MKLLVIVATALCISLCAAAQNSQSAEGARVLALDNSWNRALETNDTKAFDCPRRYIRPIDIDGSIQTKREVPAAAKMSGYQAPSQAVTEQSKVEVYGVGGRPRDLSHEKHRQRQSVTQRERFLDTWSMSVTLEMRGFVAVRFTAKGRFVGTLTARLRLRKITALQALEESD